MHFKICEEARPHVKYSYHKNKNKNKISGMQDIFECVDMSIILNLVTPWEFACIQIHQIVHIKYLQTFIY